METFEICLNCYLDKQERVFTQYAAKKATDAPIDALVGFQKGARKYQRAHFDWLARFQVKGESFGDIRGSVPHVSVKAVEQAVRRIAKLIGLTLRPLKRTGRPSGKGKSRERDPRK